MRDIDREKLGVSIMLPYNARVTQNPKAHVRHLCSKLSSRELVCVIMLWRVRLCAQLAENLHHRLHSS